jgi:hypothetical protein
MAKCASGRPKGTDLAVPYERLRDCRVGRPGQKVGGCHRVKHPVEQALELRARESAFICRSGTPATTVH